MFVIVTKYLIPKGFAGLALFPFIFLKEKKHVHNVVMIQHEKIHIRQQIELLIVPFYVWYFVEFLFRYLQHKNKELAYRNISFEREAYQNESKIGFLEHRSFWNFLKYLK